MTSDTHLRRVAVGIPGLEQLTGGGLPANRLTLVAGTAGSGKTIFAAQFLAAGIETAGEPGVFVTFEERPESMRQNLRSLGWDISAYERAGSWLFVDASPRHQVDTVFTGGSYDLSPLTNRIRHAVASTGARRVALDSVGALVGQFDGVAPARQALFHLAGNLERAGVTTVMTGERGDDYGPLTRLGFEEFIADNVVILRNALAGEKRRRTIEVLKLRGGGHRRGEHLFTLLDGQGIVVVPMSVETMDYPTSTRRLSCGVAGLDAMFDGGLFERSLWLVAGSTGSGKSLLATHFVAGGVAAGQRCVLNSFEESHDQLLRNAASWGIELEAMEAGGNLRIVAEAPESASLEDHLQRMKATVDTFRPQRVAIDSLSALQRIATVKSFRDYALELSFYIKRRSMLGLMTHSDRDLITVDPATDLHVSTISDVITLLHYVPVGNELQRGAQVLKMRGSDHDKTIRRFTITGTGMNVGEPFEEVDRLL